MQGSKQLIKANVIRLNDVLCVEIPKKDMPKRSRNSNPQILNKIDDLVVVGDTVEGYLFEYNKTESIYRFYITNNVTRSMDKGQFVDMVNHIVVDRINDELTLFDTAKRYIEYNRLAEKIRWREYVVARYIAIIVVVDILNGQINDTYLAGKYNLHRTTVIHARKELEKYGFSTHITGIINDCMAKANHFYESLKQPRDIEVFEFIPQ